MSKWNVVIAAIITASGAVVAASIPIFFRDGEPKPTPPIEAPVDSATLSSGGASLAPAPETPATEPPIAAATDGFSLAQATAAIPVRAGPGLDTRKLFDIPGGRTFRLATDGGSSSWIRIEFEGRSGYVRKGRDYVSAD